MPMPMPINASKTAIIMNIITATILIASAFNQPQLKKCFTSPRIITIRIKEAIIPVKK